MSQGGLADSPWCTLLCNQWFAVNAWCKVSYMGLNLWYTHFLSYKNSYRLKIRVTNLFLNENRVVDKKKFNIFNWIQRTRQNMVVKYYLKPLVSFLLPRQNICKRKVKIKENTQECFKLRIQNLMNEGNIMNYNKIQIKNILCMYPHLQIPRNIQFERKYNFTK